jgi:hypothetical protein
VRFGSEIDLIFYQRSAREPTETLHATSLGAPADSTVTARPTTSLSWEADQLTVG